MSRTRSQIVWKRWISQSIEQLEPLKRLVTTLRALEKELETSYQQDRSVDYALIAKEIGKNSHYVRKIHEHLIAELSGHNRRQVGFDDTLPAATADIESLLSDDVLFARIANDRCPETYHRWKQTGERFQQLLLARADGNNRPYGARSMLLRFWGMRVATMLEKAYFDKIELGLAELGIDLEKMGHHPQKDQRMAIYLDLCTAPPDYALMESWLHLEHHQLCDRGIQSWRTTNNNSLHQEWRRCKKWFQTDQELVNANNQFRKAYEDFAECLVPETRRGRRL